MAKKTIMAVASIIVIIGCVWFMLPEDTSIPKDELVRPYVCEACGHKFTALPEATLMECPKCKKKAALRYHEYECRKCGERFEAFRERQATDQGAAPDPNEPPVMEYKQPGGEWATELGRITCPKCNSTDVGPPRQKPKDAK